MKKIIIFTVLLVFISLQSVYAVADTTPPTVPQNLVVTARTSNSVSLAWSASTDNVGVTSYIIYNGSTAVRTINKVSAPISGLAANTTYTFTVKATDAAGNTSAASNTVTVSTDVTPPTVPQNLVLRLRSNTSIGLAWSTSTDNVGVTNYIIYNGSNVVLSTTNTTATITGLATNTTYTFTVKAIDAAGNTSAASNAVTASTDVTPPTAPQNLVVTSKTSNSVSLAWSASTDNVGVANYIIYNGSNAILTINKVSAPISGLAANTTYTFTVKAKDAAGNTSAASNTVTVKL